MENARRAAPMRADGNARHVRVVRTDESNLRVPVHRGSQSPRCAGERSSDYESTMLWGPDRSSEKAQRQPR